MDTELLEKICKGVMVIGTTVYVVSSTIALKNSFEITDEYRKELVRILKTNKESE